MIKRLAFPLGLWHTLFMDTVAQKVKRRANHRILSRPPIGDKIMAAPSTSKTIEVSKNVFDLTSKEYVTLKKTGEFVPVTTMQEFTERLGNDAGLILELANKALEVHAEKAIEQNDSPWLQVDEAEDGTETLVPFDGQALSAEKAKTLQASVIQFAKLLFGYSKNMVAGNKEENRKAKAAAKDQALAAILSAPGAIERLK